MFQNYLTIAIRSMMRQKGYSFINIVGLAVGVSACVLIALYLSHELSYDKHNSKADRIYRATSNMRLTGQTDAIARSSYMLAPTLKRDYPEIEEAVRVIPSQKQTMWYDNRVFQSEKVCFSEAGFFSIFDFTFTEGDPKTALQEPQSAVVTEEIAVKIFGSSSGVLGKMLQFSKSAYKITGVVKAPATPSHLVWEVMLSANSLPKPFIQQVESDWFYMAQFNYILFRKASDRAGFEAKLAALREQYIVPWLKQVQVQGDLTFGLQPLGDIHFNSAYQFDIAERTNKSALVIFGAVGVFILLVACINYMNLATARSLKRAKEVAIRKTAGAVRWHLMAQFLGEAVFTALIAIALALMLAEVMLPTFNDLTGKTLVMDFSPRFVLSVIGLVLFVGIVAGSYPAFFLAGFEPTDILKSNRLARGSGVFVRKALVVLQFAISIVLIVATGVVFLQMRYMKSKDLGFNKDQVLVLKVPVQDSTVLGQMQVLKNELLRNPSITQVAGSGAIPGVQLGQVLHFIPTGSKNEERLLNVMTVDEDLMKMLGITIAKGRGFAKEFTADKQRSFIVNEAAVRQFGWKNPIGMKILNGLGYDGEIIGVAKDFNFASLHSPIEPLVILLSQQPTGFLLLKLKPDDIAATVRFVETTWGRFSQRFPTEYYFLDEHFDKQYRAESRLQTVFTYFAGVTIVIACLGLFGLAAFAAEQRTKEIGIRKVLGASVASIIGLLSKDFLRLVGVAMLIALPLAYWGADKWLQDFAYRMGLSWWIFALAGALAVFIAFTTVASQAWRAARTNPVQALRSE
jgi:putative ABC transport system permease protein